MLEEGSFRGRTADFVFMFLFGGVLMIVSFLGSGTAGQALLRPACVCPGHDISAQAGRVSEAYSGLG